MCVRAFGSMVLAAGLLLCAIPARATQTPDALIEAARGEMMNAPDAALAHAEQAERLLDGRPGEAADRARATAQWLHAEALSRLDASDRAAPVAAAALDRVTHRWPRSKLHADLLMTSGGIAMEQNRMGDALADFQRAHNLFRDLGESRSQTIALLMLANLYQSGNDHATALRYFGEAIGALHGGDRNLLVALHNNRGNSFDSLLRYEDAAREYGEALKIARAMDAPPVLTQVLTNVARVSIARGRLGASERYLAEAFGVARRAHVVERPIFVVSARLALARNDPRRAAALLERIFERVDLATTPPAMLEGHRAAYETYRRLGRLQDALAHLAAAKRIDDAASRLATDTSNALMSARFDSSNKELKIARLRAEEARRSAELAQTRAFFQLVLLGGTLFAVVAGTGLLGFFYFQIRRSRNQVRAANVGLEASNAALARALRAKSDFLATTSHEFRTPLNGILGMTQVLLADPAIPAPAHGRIELLHDAGRAMYTLVEDVLDIAMLDSGKVALANAPFDLRALLAGLAAHWQTEAATAGLAFACDIAACPGVIEGDARRIGQVVTHLLSNAIKFTPQGSVALSVSRLPGNEIEIAVADSGIGIAPDQHALVFEKFHQVDTGTRRRFAGVGVGLAVARNLAVAMNGAIDLESAPGEGATFRFRLPVREAAAPSTTPANGIRLADAALLLVEPNRLAQSVTVHGLKPLAASVEAVADLAAAEARLAQGGIHHLIVQAEAAAGSDAPIDALKALAAAAARAGAATTILYAPAGFTEQDLAATGAARLLAKPVALPALAEALAPPDSPDQATTRAA